MPRAGCIVHAGGVGTTAQAMRSGRPMLVVPSSNDQLDHADHVRRLGIAREVHQKCLTVGRAARELERLLRDPSFGRRAESVASQLSREKRCHRRGGRPRTGLRYDGSPRGGLFVTYLHSLVFFVNAKYKCRVLCKVEMSVSTLSTGIRLPHEIWVITSV